MGKGKNGKCGTESIAISNSLIGETSAFATVEAIQSVSTDPEEWGKLCNRFPTLTDGVASTEWKLPSRAELSTAETLAAATEIDPVIAYCMDRDESFAALQDLDADPLTADFGYHKEEEFLHPSRDLIRSAEQTMPGCKKAARALQARLEAGEKIAVFADYDIDGIGSAVVFSAAVEAAGGSEDQLTWAHASGSFGLTPEFVRQAHAEGATMLVTLDCGSAQVSEIALAHQLGMETIIIDHHDAAEDTDADHHLNPRYLSLSRHKRWNRKLSAAEKLIAESKLAHENSLMFPDDKEAQAELAQCKEKAEQLVTDLDKFSGVETEAGPGQLLRALENARLQGDPALANHNSAGQLTWKFGGELIEASGRKVPEEWYGTPLYMGGQSALGDMVPMGAATSENRAFVRLPVEGHGAEVVPPVLRSLAEHFGEDPTRPDSMIQTRAALNLAKRTTRVDAKDIADAIRAKTPEEAERLLKPLLKEYTYCKSLREDKMLPDTLADAKARVGKNREPKVVSALLEGYPEDQGQARLLANKLAREYGVPAAVGVVNEEGIVKVSWSAPKDGLNFGSLILDNDQLRSAAEQACQIERTDENGDVHVSSSVGGHTAVLSGSCRKERFDEFVAVGEAAHDSLPANERRKKWYKRTWNGAPSAWVAERMVSPERIKTISEQSKLLSPLPSWRMAPSVSAAVRLVELGDSEDGKIFPAVLALADGTEYQADLTEDAKKILSSRSWFEAVVSPGKPRWYVSKVAPINT